MDKIVRFVNAEDLKLLYVFNNRIKCTVLDFVMPYITKLGGAFITIMTCFILIASGNGLVRLAGLECLITLSLSHVLVHFLKKIFIRPRPFSILSNINTFNIKLYDYSFPSGHTTAAFSMCLTLSLLFPTLIYILVPLALIVGISRVYLGVHYPSDVLVGIIIALVFSVCTNVIFNDWLISIFVKGGIR